MPVPAGQAGAGGRGDHIIDPKPCDEVYPPGITIVICVLSM